MKYVEAANKLMNQINTVVIGKEEKVTLAVISLLAGGHLLLEDVPGVGKTTLALAIAKSIDVSFGRIQFTPDTLPSDVTGVSVYNMKTSSFEYQKGVVLNHIVLADEINRTAPKTQACLLEAMEEHQVTVDGEVHMLPDPFMVIATQNPIDFMGTYNLPEAQLDRFLMKITIGYPSLLDEQKMAGQYLHGVKVSQLKPIMTAQDVTRMQQEVREVYVHKDITAYIVAVMEATRNDERLTLGASPRATLALIRAAQATAYLRNRDYVIPDDVQEVIYAVLCHRLIVSMEARINKVTPEQILKNILIHVTVPILKNFNVQ